MTKSVTNRRGTAPAGPATLPSTSGDAPPPLLSLAETARILGLSLKTLQRRIRAGEVVVVRDGRRVRVHPADLARYVAARRSL